MSRDGNRWSDNQPLPAALPALVTDSIVKRAISALAGSTVNLQSV